MPSEKGFIYPLSLCIYLLFIQFLILFFGIYINKRTIELESVNSIMQEYYFLSALVDIEDQLVHNESPSSTGVYAFVNGDVYYTIVQQSSVDYKIDYQLWLSGKKPISGTSYFNKEQNKMIKWVEIN